MADPCKIVMLQTHVLQSTANGPLLKMMTIWMDENGNLCNKWQLDLWMRAWSSAGDANVVRRSSTIGRKTKRLIQRPSAKSCFLTMQSLLHNYELFHNKGIVVAVRHAVSPPTACR